MRTVAIIALLGGALYVVGIITHDGPLADVGGSAFILGSLGAGALSLRKRHQQQRSQVASQGNPDRVPLTTALVESAVRSLDRKKDGNR